MAENSWRLVSVRTEITQDLQVKLSLRVAKSEEDVRKNQLKIMVFHPLDKEAAIRLGQQIVLAAREVNQIQWTNSADPSGGPN